jgi:hypothetical protein
LVSTKAVIVLSGRYVGKLALSHSSNRLKEGCAGAQSLHQAGSSDTFYGARNMHSDACKNFQCQNPLKLRNRHTGEVFELMRWDWPQGIDQQVAQLMNGQRIDEMTLAEHYEVMVCEHCGEENPAARWPEAAHAA